MKEEEEHGKKAQGSHFRDRNNGSGVSMLAWDSEDQIVAPWCTHDSCVNLGKTLSLFVPKFFINKMRIRGLPILPVVRIATLKIVKCSDMTVTGIR